MDEGLNEFTPPVVEASSLLSTKEIKLTLEGLKEFSQDNLVKRDNDTSKNQELVREYSERFRGKTEEGESVDIQFSSEDAKNIIKVDGVDKKVVAKVWITQKGEDESNAFCYQLTETGEWILGKSDEKPTYVKEKHTDYWKIKDTQKASKLDLSSMSNYLKSTRAKSQVKETPKN